QHVPFFRPLVRRLRQDRAADSEIKAKDRCDREKIAARGAIDITAFAAATPAFPDLAHYSSRIGASDRCILPITVNHLAKSTQPPRTVSGVVGLRNPPTGSIPCCARAASGHPAAAPPSRVMKSRRFN